MPRKLNSRRLKFAAAVASGKTQMEAYQEAGYAANGKRETASRHARQLAQDGEVRASIEEMRQLLLPAPGDEREIREHALAVIVELSREAKNERVRLEASEWLHEEMGKRMAERERREAEKGADREQRPEIEIVAQLRALYQKALPSQEPPLVEAVRDEMADGQAGEAPAENLPQVAGRLVEVAVEAESACGEDEAPEPGQTATAEGSFVAEHLNRGVQYRLEHIPGSFPPKYRRVPIEP